MKKTRSKTSRDTPFKIIIRTYYRTVKVNFLALFAMMDRNPFTRSNVHLPKSVQDKQSLRENHGVITFTAVSQLN
jgi:hypothetical protein